MKECILQCQWQEYINACLQSYIKYVRKIYSSGDQFFPKMLLLVRIITSIIYCFYWFQQFMRYHIIWHLVVQDPWLTKCLVSLLIFRLEFHFPSVLKSTTWSTTGYVMQLYSSLDIRTYIFNALIADINMKCLF